MRKFLSFWWLCAKRAFWGNAPFANDWQWLIGYPAVAVALWIIGYFYAEFSVRVEVTLTTGALGALSAAFAAFIITWLVAFIVRFANAPVVLYDEQKDRAEARSGYSEASEILRLATQKLLRYPDAVQNTVAPPTMIERFATDQQPRRLFELLLRYEEKDIGAVPGIGEKLREHFALYYGFRQSALQFDDDLLTKIINGHDWVLAAWRIHQRYVVLRLFGASKEQIIAWGNFLNYSITWDAAEKMFERVSGDSAIKSTASQLGALHERLSAMIIALKALT